MNLPNLYNISNLGIGKECFSICTRQSLIEYTITSNNLIYLNNFLKTQDHITACYDIFAVHYPSKKTSKNIIISYVYVMLSKALRFRIRLITSVFSLIPSIQAIFKSGNWLEREVYDMFGTFFTNHPDLRRILTDYGFEGQPLLKDFPLSGFYEIAYSFESKLIERRKNLRLKNAILGIKVKINK
jgi:NADH:ubiquinone oxidoreductase subunit C